MHLDLSDEETAALTQELQDITESDRQPLAPRDRTLKAILAKLRSEPVLRTAAGVTEGAPHARPRQREHAAGHELKPDFIDDEDIFPDPPSFSDENIRRARDTGDYKPMLFEWYKFVAALGFGIVNIIPTCPAFRSIPVQHYHVLMGLLNRCTRLMLSNVALSHEGKFGETTAIVDRCVFESAIKIIWLCDTASQEEFTRYLADGLKTELEFKAHIEGSIEASGGVALPIEARMLRSISNHIAASGLTEAEIGSSKRLRNLAAIIEALGFDRRLYITAQGIGSHHIHGTWSSLLFHYLEEKDGLAPFMFAPRGHDVPTHINQYMFVPRIMLHAMSAYVGYTLKEEEAEEMQNILETTSEEIMRVYGEAGDDAR